MSETNNWADVELRMGWAAVFSIMQCAPLGYSSHSSLRSGD
jgi:hypothetical protein